MPASASPGAGNAERVVAGVLVEAGHEPHPPATDAVHPFGEGLDQHPDQRGQIVAAAVGVERIEQGAPAGVEGGEPALEQRFHQPVTTAEVIVDRTGVALAGGLTDLP